MKRSRKCILFLVAMGVIFSVSETLAQDTPLKALVVNGRSVDAGIVQVGGRSYADIEGLAQVMGGSVVFAPNQITLTIPEPAPAAAPAATSPTAPEVSDTMSKQFQQVAVLTLAEMRELRGAIGTVITSGLPVVGTWPEDYHDHVAADLLQATLGASTVSDNQAVQLLQKEYALLTDWASNVVSERKALNAARTTDPNSINNDQSLAKISKCGQFLSSMIVGGNFYDDSSCQ